MIVYLPGHGMRHISIFSEIIRTRDSYHILVTHGQLIPNKQRNTTDAGLMLTQCRRRWVNINPALCQRLLFAGILMVF